MSETPTETVFNDGTVTYKNSAGKYHREDGPAVVWANGRKAWFLHGKYHREGGPAVEWADGTKSWYLHGRQVDEETYEHVRTCPLEELPEYLGTDYECVAKKRLAA